MKIAICPCGKGLQFKNKAQEKRKKYCSRICLYRYRIRPSGIFYIIKKENQSWFKKGHKSWNKGVMIGSGNYSNGYDAIHEWVERWLGKPEKCEQCGKNKNLQWSNIREKYKRIFYDWQRLCAKCHHRYDYENFGLRKAFYRT